MDVQEVVAFVDRLILERTGRHLDDVQKALVEGTWERKTYDEIAKQIHVTKNHLGDVGYELWELLSSLLGQDIKKANFRSTLERISHSNSNIYNYNITNIHGNYNYPFCQQPVLPSSESFTQESAPHQPLSDLSLAPNISCCYDRSSALNNLNQLILKERIRLITVLGSSGMGKTTLIKAWIDQQGSQEFEGVIWRSLEFPQSLNDLLDDLLEICDIKSKASTINRLHKVISVLSAVKFLIVLDNIENLFSPGVFAGEYKSEYKDYQNFFRLFAETNHQSHLVLIGQEASLEIQALNTSPSGKQCLEVSGISDLAFIKVLGLKESDRLLDFLNLYEGNPGYLYAIADLIQNIFSGDVDLFLGEKTIVIPSVLQANFQEHWNRLSKVEQTIALALTDSDRSLSIRQLKERLDLAVTNLINGLRSLQNRYCLNTVEDVEDTYFEITPVFKAFINLIK